MKISIIGTGYVGLVTGVCLAKVGHDVICMDHNDDKVQKLHQGVSPIYEPGIEELVKECIQAEKIDFTTDLGKAVDHADALFFALPTPPGEDGSADLSYVLGAAENIAKLLKKYTVIVNKSTVPVGSADKVEELMSSLIDKELFDIVSNPEFLREGKAIDDFLHPDRIVVGVETERAREVMKEVYAPFEGRVKSEEGREKETSQLTTHNSQLILMDRHSSEMTKYVANTFLAMKISFMNEMSRLAEDLGADIEKVKHGVGTDHRIAPHFINPGVGYGGSCFPKDVLALEKMAQQQGEGVGIVDMIIDGNRKQRKFFFEKIVQAFAGDLQGKKLALWGLAFKPDTDDIREAPALEIIEWLTEAGGEVFCYDPQAKNSVVHYFNGRGLPRDQHNRIFYADDQYDALIESDALIILTEWTCFVESDLEKVKKLLKNPLIIDGRNCLDLDKIQELGFRYVSIGRADIGK